MYKEVKKRNRYTAVKTQPLYVNLSPDEASFITALAGGEGTPLTGGVLSPRDSYEVFKIQFANQFCMVGLLS